MTQQNPDGDAITGAQAADVLDECVGCICCRRGKCAVYGPVQCVGVDGYSHLGEWWVCPCVPTGPMDLIDGDHGYMVVMAPADGREPWTSLGSPHHPVSLRVAQDFADHNNAMVREWGWDGEYRVVPVPSPAAAP